MLISMHYSYYQTSRSSGQRICFSVGIFSVQISARSPVPLNEGFLGIPQLLQANIGKLLLHDPLLLYPYQLVSVIVAVSFGSHIYGAEPFLRRSQICSFSRISQHFLNPKVLCRIHKSPSLVPILS
jgi:hypothetical protein